VRIHATSKLLLGQAPVPGGSEGAPKNDRRVTGKAPVTGRRMDGSGRSEASPATAYSVFTERMEAWHGQPTAYRRRGRHGGLTIQAFSWKFATRSSHTTFADRHRVWRPLTGRIGSDGGRQRLSVASSSSRASLCGLRIA
jgi:hypothetical protein